MVSQTQPPEGDKSFTRDIDVLRQAVASVRDRMPAGWTTRAIEPNRTSNRRSDAVLEVIAPDGTSASLVFEAKSSLVKRDLPAMIKQVTSYVEQLSAPAIPVITARYLAPPIRAWLEEHGVSYVDATGNIHIAGSQPAIFLRDKGADHDPWRGPGRPRGSLKGPPAARVVRALVDFKPPMTVRELARQAGTSTGTAYRVVDFLEQEMLIDRRARGPIADVQWRRLLERWSQDYGFQQDNSLGSYLQPRGLPAVIDGLATASDLQYVLTGSLAAQRLAPYAQARLAMIYVDDRDAAAKRLKLRQVDSGANVLLASSTYDVVFDRSVEVAGVRYAAPSQTVVDLLTGPGRNPVEAQALLDWMENHEPEWRH